MRDLTRPLRSRFLRFVVSFRGAGRGMWVTLLCGALLCASGVFGVSQARARREQTFGYAYSRVWTSAVRLLRVDFEANITEKDKEDGYFLFEYPDRGKVYAGSCELVSVKQDDSEAVRVVITIQALPTYVENMIMDRLARKLEQEFGAQHEAKPKKPADSSKDDGDAPPAQDRPKAPAAKGPRVDKQANRVDSD